MIGIEGTHPGLYTKRYEHSCKTVELSWYLDQKLNRSEFDSIEYGDGDKRRSQSSRTILHIEIVPHSVPLIPRDTLESTLAIWAWEHLGGCKNSTSKTERSCGQCHASNQKGSIKWESTARHRRNSDIDKTSGRCFRHSQCCGKDSKPCQPPKVHHTVNILII